MKAKLWLIGMVAAFAVSGCGERAQVVHYQNGKYEGKADAQPWDNDPSGALYTTSKWTAGDKASWEHAIRLRNQRQNEYTRVQ